MTTSGRPSRSRCPAGKIYWDPAATHKSHREWVTVCQHCHQGAAPPTPPEVGQQLDKILPLVHNYSIYVLGTLRYGNNTNVNGVRLIKTNPEELDLQTPLFLQHQSLTQKQVYNLACHLVD
jgi:hypothetical protein